MLRGVSSYSPKKRGYPQLFLNPNSFVISLPLVAKLLQLLYSRGMNQKDFAIQGNTPWEYVYRMVETYRLTTSQARILREAEQDLAMWNMGPLEASFSPAISDQIRGKDRGRSFMSQLEAHMRDLREEPADYTNFIPLSPSHAKSRGIQENPSPTILSRCPVADKETRCCNLQTLDVVTQCAFGCTYCAIRSFYRNDRVLFPTGLREQLASLELDPDTTYHIGTGQSSDSLLWGDHGGLLRDLFEFARNNPQVILELKTKAAGVSIEEALALDPPKNVLFTWSLNPQTIIQKEEHQTASLLSRLDAAEQVAAAGYLVGFHFHPMVWYRGWQEDYHGIAHKIMERFTANQVVMISLGTLTFTKAVLKQLREEGVRTLTTKIPFEPAANKLSYPYAIKEELFSGLFNSFTQEWQEEVFFYLCMEDPALWEPVFGRSYSDNNQFEEAMNAHYRRKVSLLG